MNLNDTSHSMDPNFECLHCNAKLLLPRNQAILFCPVCGKSILEEQKNISPPHDTTDVITLVQGHAPQKENIQYSIGSYQIVNSIGKGGMGEVLLAYDTVCGRKIALKKIRKDLVSLGNIQNRFLKEARITCQLTHPAIIPIYSIHKDPDLAYYTMPFVEGETLKQILRKTRIQEKKGERLDHVGGSIPALIRIFITICQAVGYAHSKGVLHRDLKPENIIIGKYGEVMILDWGLAKLLQDLSDSHGSEEELKASENWHHLTRIGKVVGTVSYMAPERGLGQPATIQTDIYALGVILYQMLTLRLPFRRGSLKEFREGMSKETLSDPVEIAPYRDVPKILATIATRCLAVNPSQRYHSADELIRDLENYIEGRTEWFQIAELDVNNKQDWEFQENILIAEHTAITRNTEISEWVSLMISKASFAENIRIEAKVRLEKQCMGLGFLLNVPEFSERRNINDGYCLWIGSDQNKNTKLLKSSLEVLLAEEIFLQREEWYQVKIEKVDNTIRFYLNDILQFSYISRMPLVGTHVGLIARDADFELRDFFIYVGSQNITVNCLAVPDAFLAHKDYQTALSEYRRIGYAFPGRAEGREAILRAGITLLEQAKNTANRPASNELLDASLNEFEKLHSTAGAPLEYLGKALVYQFMKDDEEEIKCFELAARRYKKHPLLHVLEDQAIFRMQESSRTDRKATYNFLLLTLRFIQRYIQSNQVQKLITSLKKHWEPLPFVDPDPLLDPQSSIPLAISLAFWLDKPYILEEIIEELKKMEPRPLASIANALYCLIELGHHSVVSDLLKKLPRNHESFAILKVINETDVSCLRNSLEQLSVINGESSDNNRALDYLLGKAIDLKETSLIYDFTSPSPTLSSQCFRIWALLLDHKTKEAAEILHTFSFEALSRETSFLYFLYGCWLFATEGKEIAQVHFSGVLDVPYPRTYTLGSHFINCRLTEGWFRKAFNWEKKQLNRQIELLTTIQAL
ncbi:Serine/threonine-protein kinase PknD [Chlamydiales bacterium STE3]|nr:Serine/threonine-protein kinase PknD [Chlamydiales bacterium STE3]